MPVRVKDPTDISSAYDERANTLRASEQQGSGAGYVSSGLDQLESFANDPANHAEDDISKGVDQAEAYANNPANSTSSNIGAVEGSQSANSGWINNTSPSAPGEQAMSNGKKAMKLLRKSGPTGGIVGVLIAGALGIGGLVGAPATLLNHLAAGALEKWDTRTTTASIRTNKILVKKLVGDTTNGTCTNYVKLMCRFARPSSKLLRNLEKQGVRALDDAGHVISPNKVLPNTRPKSYELTRSNGITSEISAAQFSRSLQDDVEFRKAFHIAYNTRFENFVDSTFNKVLARFGGSKTSKVAGAADEKAARDKINADVGGEDTGARAAVAEGSEEATDGVIKKLLGKEVSGILAKLSKAGSRGSGISLAMGAVCIAADAPGITAKIVRTYQMAQLIKYALVFLTVSDKLRAGDATPTEVGALGAILTAVARDSNGNVTSRAATDSFGVKYMLFGDTSTTQQTAGHNYTKFSPGGNAVASLSGIAKYTDSKQKNDSCAMATNPLTGTAINAALVLNSGETLGITAAIAALNFAGGIAAGFVLEKAAGPIGEFVATNLGPAFKDMLGFFMGDLTKDIANEDAGNGFASGAAHLLGQAANAGGNVPMSIADTVVYDKMTKQVNLAYAEEDRLGRSPFDVSSPNTFFGSIANKLIPYYSSMSSVSGFFSAMSSISLGSFGLLLGSSASAASGQEYTMCDDTSINDGSMAVGPFCNIIYGIPTQYLDIEPDAVVQYLIDNGQIDADSGEPIPDKDLELWIGNCLDGKTDQAANCRIDSDNTSMSDTDRKKFAYFSLYTVDHQIQKSMDGEDIGGEQSTTASDTPGTVASTVTSTEWKSYSNGKIPLSALTPISSVGFSGCSNAISVPYLAPSALQALKQMNDAFKSDSGKSFELSSCYRTYDQQKVAWARYRAGGNEAARPGTSNHGKSQAVDITMEKYGGYNSPQYKWLKKNATKYHWITGRVSREPWHIEYTGSLP